MAGNPIFNMMQGMGGTPAQGAGGNPMDFMNMLNGKFGNMGNAMKQLQGLMGKKGMNPQQMAMKELQGKKFDQKTIDDFKVFAKSQGASDQDIDRVLKQIGMTK